MRTLVTKQDATPTVEIPLGDESRGTFSLLFVVPDVESYLTVPFDNMAKRLDHFLQKVCGWKDVDDASGKPAQYTRDNLKAMFAADKALLEQFYFAVNPYWLPPTKDEQKNSPAPSGDSSVAA
jgi:hypothetical protein